MTQNHTDTLVESNEFPPLVVSDEFFLVPVEEWKAPPEFVLSDVSPRLKEEIAGATGPIHVFSPFVTSRAAQEVLANASGKECELYTLFSPLGFASGSSSLSALKSLLDIGIKLYELPKLHAKMIIIPGRFASIGSQNLTSRGRSNQEASVVITAPSEVEHVWRLAKEWLRERQEITAERIADMQAALGPLKAMFFDIRSKASEVREITKSKQRQREWLACAQAIDEALSALPCSTETITATVDFRDRGCRERENTPYRLYRLMTDGARDLTKWRVGTEQVALKRLHRYLCILRGTGRIGWVRVAKTRASYVEDGVRKIEPISIAGCKYIASFSADWGVGEAQAHENHDDGPQHNLTVEFEPVGCSKPALRVRCCFSVNTLQVREIENPNAPQSSEACNVITEWIRDCNEEFQARLTEILLSSFKFQQPLLGPRVEEFFGGHGTRFSLRCYLIRSNPVLVATQLS